MREKIPKTESPSKRQFKDNETAEDVREKAMVCLKRPRNAIQTKEELLQNVIESLVDFLREKTAAEVGRNRSYVQNNRNRRVNSK